MSQTMGRDELSDDQLRRLLEDLGLIDQDQLDQLNKRAIKKQLKRKVTQNETDKKNKNS